METRYPADVYRKIGVFLITNDVLSINYIDSHVDLWPPPFPQRDRSISYKYEGVGMKR